MVFHHVYGSRQDEPQSVMAIASSDLDNRPAARISGYCCLVSWLYSFQRFDPQNGSFNLWAVTVKSKIVISLEDLPHGKYLCFETMKFREHIKW